MAEHSHAIARPMADRCRVSDLFPQARPADLDLAALSRRLVARKLELFAQGDPLGLPMSETRVDEPEGDCAAMVQAFDAGGPELSC